MAVPLSAEPAAYRPGMPPPRPSVRGRLVGRLEQMPLRVRLVAIVLGLLTVALVATSLTTAYLVRRDLMDRVDVELHAVAEPVARQAIGELRLGGDSTPTGYAFVLMAPDGTIVRAVDPTGEALQPDLPALSVRDPRVRSGEPFTVRSRNGETKWRFVAGRVGDDVATFAVGTPLRGVNHTVAQLIATSGLISALVLAGSAMIGWYAVRRAFRPLEQIEDTAAAIAGGDLTRRIPERHTDDEIASLAASLNVMLSRIESSFAVREASEERMRQFVSDASHELRTPLATVQGYAELHRQGAMTDPEAVGAAMTRIEAEAGRMRGLVEDLLMLARLDEVPDAAMGEVDLTVLAADAVEDARARAPRRVVRLVGLDGPLGATATWGAEPQLRQVVTNLLANALTHTPEGSPIEVAVGSRSGTAVLEVRDHGDGVSPEVATRVFERFYRADPSRGRSGGGGNGLGLAIVAAIVAAHHGRVGLDETPGGGATFVVHLPPANSQPASRGL